MRFIALPVLFFTACAVKQPLPPAFGFAARQCVLNRPVVCVPDKDMTEAWCETRVRDAILAINDAVGQPMFVYGGALEPNEQVLQQAAMSGRVIVWTDSLKEQLGVTHYNLKNECVGITTIVLDKELQFGGEYEKNALTTITHELIHVLGAEHSADSGAWPTIMTPSIAAPNSSPCISEQDRATLRMAYPR